MSDNEFNKALPAGVEGHFYMNRLCRIAVRISVGSFIFGVLSLMSNVLSWLLLGAAWLLVLAAIIITFGAVFAAAPGIIDGLTSGSDFLTSFTEKFVKLWPIFATITLVAAGVALFMLALDKEERTRGKFIGIGFIIAASIVVIIVGSLI